jgi:hypothetical protein
MSLCSALQVLQLVGFSGPLLRVGKPGLHFGNTGPDLGQFGIQLEKYRLVLWQLVLGEDGIHRALRFAQSTVNAFIGMDNQKIGPLVKAINRADLNAVGVLTVDTILAYNKCHS